MKFFELEMDGVAGIIGKKKETFRMGDKKCHILINRPVNEQPTQTIKK